MVHVCVHIHIYAPIFYCLTKSHHSIQVSLGKKHLLPLSSNPLMRVYIYSIGIHIHSYTSSHLLYLTQLVNNLLPCDGNSTASFDGYLAPIHKKGL